MPISRRPQIVIKVSKYCNLRCDYCYEFPHLGDKRRMSLDNIRALFENVKNSAAALSLTNVDFIWHGGEPMMIPIEFYHDVARIQAEVLEGVEFKYINAVQTNLTVLTDRHLALLKSGFFNDIGVSFDVYGDQRVDTRGRLKTDTVLNNLQKLIDNQIGFGAIAVLARNTLPYVNEIYRYFDSLNINHRFLAYYRGVDDDQVQRNGIDFDELVGAHKSIFREWLASETATPVDPIDDYVQFAVRHVSQAPVEPYDVSEQERVFIVDVNGDVFNVMESYDPEFCYGNLFSQPLTEIAASDGRRRANAQSKARMRSLCGSCRYLGACPGVFANNASDLEWDLTKARGCPIVPVLDDMVGAFEQTNLRDLILRASNGEAAADAHPALGVS
ncbi:MAG: radical SAM protein [Caulobacterales bacterium]